MRGSSDLKDVDTHFAFGENWASYANLIGDAFGSGTLAHMNW